MTFTSTSFDVGLELPADWYVVDPSAPDLEAALASVVDERIDRECDLAPLRARLLRDLTDLGADAREKNALVAAALMEAAEESFSIAHLLLYLVGRDSVASSGSTESAPSTSGMATLLDEIAAGLREEREGDIGPRFVNIVDLPAGSGIRARFLGETGRDDRGRALALECVQFWLPVDGADEVVLASFTTPVLARADEFAAIFDQIARTISISVHDEGRGT